MSCAEIRDLFSARADDALAAGERAALEAHLAVCPDCAREWRRFEATVGLLRAVETARAPAGFVDRVLAARPRPWYRRLARGLLLPWAVKLPLQAAAVVLLGGLAVMTFQRSSDLQQAARPPEAPASAPAPHAQTRSPESPATETPRPRAPAAPPAESPAATRPEPDLADRAAGAAVGQAPAGQADVRAERARPSPAAPTAKRESVAPAESRGGSRDARLAAADVEARLAATDRPAAEREIRALVTRLDGVITSNAGVLEIVLPRARWDELERELGRLGALRLDRRPAEAPPSVRLTIRLD